MADQYRDLTHEAADVDSAIDSIASHVNDSTSHVTSSERESWNGKADAADVLSLQTAVEAKANAADLRAETSARQTADEGLQTAIYTEEAARLVLADSVSRLVNSGSKNLLQTYTGSGTSNVTLSTDLQAGEYIMSFGHLESTDTDYETCQVIALQGNAVVSASPQLQLSRGDNVYGKITVTSPANRIQIYASRTGSAASGDTVSFTNAMLCTEADWAVSQEFVEYCPTLAELYEMVKALQS